MKKTIKQLGVLILQSLVFWFLAFSLFTIIRYSGLKEELRIFVDEPLGLSTVHWYKYAALMGLTFGFFYAIIEFLFDEFLSKKIALGLSVIAKTIVYFVLIVAILNTISISVEIQLDLDLPNELGWWRTNKFFWNIVLFTIVSSVVFSFIKIANDKFGKGVFINMLLGKYRKPQEEKRILMFLDLKDSTTIAEQIGHVKYSQFIQDCFFDLNTVLVKYDADVYQYVGDEAVLSWPYKKGLIKNRCVNLFFAFQKQLELRSNYYSNAYNCVPKFKAGLHGGDLMIAEVGTIKKELAYHGDVINTTSRIQAECNTYNRSLLISESLLNDLQLDRLYQSTHLGNIQLKGKQEKINIHSIHN